MKAAERRGHFWCKALSCAITRADCAERHRHYASKTNYVRSGNSAGTANGVTSCACRTCEIGAAHAKGKLADVKLVQVQVQDTSGIGKRLKYCTQCSEPLPPRTGRKARVTPLCTACGGRGEVGFWEDEQFA